MKLTRSTRIALGIVTFLVAIYPFVSMALAIGAMFSAPLLAGQDTARRLEPTIFGFFAVIFPVMACLGFFQLALQIFYVIHIIKNKAGAEVYRILAAVGLYFLPWLAMPAYYLMYIWPDPIPDWALEGK